jgi:RNA polymerase sigma factor (sigma-70 family)
MLNPWKVAADHEDLFLERYRRLLGVSLKLTNRNREQAEDLLHDAFVQFTLSRPDLSAIQNLDGYLYAMLRNMHLSNIRRMGRMNGQPVSLVDYDSMDVALMSANHHVLVAARDELRAICNYACFRKETSKVGSVLILRFFHGYYPGEIAEILRSPRKAVDDWLHLARRETRLNLSDPGRFNVLRPPGSQVMPENGVSTIDFVNSMRDGVFRSRRGDCLTAAQFDILYADEPSGPVDSKTLAHIVSCRTCLDEVNARLGLDP